ncbi:ATP-binding cassette domain-containing protein [Marinobacter salinisoli]|uniref:ATP-binding cassette domain-containing protein n=1 Tax=Marinobacter salinisoli TaxID=2769486 RepID=A0ABX7MNY1_9GAMM|nr:ATP-binding cassette domain-containing protein [Marinobacter salinisoli]QSP93985.1 ATP-binding cassette domain-containing protein [Marinobacter salinisoli]
MLDVKSLKFAYQSAAEPWCFDFKAEPGECLAISGPSGSGKSTLLALLAGFLAPSSGHIAWKGESIILLPPWQRPMTSVFQEHNLFEHLNVETNIGLGIHPGLKLSARQKRSIEEHLERVGLPGLGRRMPGELSGGQRQRVAIVRAVLREQPILLLDEPLTGLDEATRATVRELLMAQKAKGVTQILASHDQEDRNILADKQFSL